MDYIIEVLLYLLQGSKTTLLVFSMTLLSIPLGLFIAVIRKLNIPLVSKIIDLYTWVIRGTPLLLQIFFVVYGVPILFGSIFLIDEIYGAVLTFIINYTAYFVEIFRGGMNAIPKSQYDASKALSLNPYQMYRYVILPQTIHKTLPSIANEMITLVKDTALVSAVAISDILRNTRETVSRDFRVEAYFIAAILYLIFTYVIVFIFKRIEKRRLVAYGVN